MTCINCGKHEFVRANNHNTCTGCGLQAEYNPKYCQSYAQPMYHFRKQYYSRAKRFTRVLKSKKSELIAQHFEDILQLYSLIEFLWIIKSNKERRYFFSQKVILWFILRELGINMKVPVLKNKERSYHQVHAIMALLRKYNNSAEKWIW